MQINQVAQSLEALQRELETLAPAVKHIDAARRVTEAASNIPDETLYFLEKLENKNAEQLLGFKAELTSHLDALKSQQKHLLDQHSASASKAITEAGEAVSNARDGLLTLRQKIESAHEAQITGIKSDLEGHLTSLREIQKGHLEKQSAETSEMLSDLTRRLDQADQSLRSADQRMSETLLKVDTTLAETSGKIEITVLAQVEAVTALCERIAAYLKKLEEIDFPTRLDKLDATVSGIMAATQTTQGRVDNLERSTLEKFGMLSAQLEKEKAALSAKVESSGKAIRTLSMITLVVSILSLCAIAYLLLNT